jgi:hypothetical protein
MQYGMLHKKPLVNASPGLSVKTLSFEHKTLSYVRKYRAI